MTHKGITSQIVRDIMLQLKEYMESDIEDSVAIDLPDSDNFYYKKIYGVTCDFVVELYLTKTTEDKYMIIGDAPGVIEEDNIRIGIYANPENYKTQLSEIYFNLIYTVRHELEHLFQVISYYSRGTYQSRKKYRGDSLATLMKQWELEPQTLGYHLQSKKENKPFETVVLEHLSKLEKNNQIKFKSEDRKNILVDELIHCAKILNLKLN